jgi:lactoylglutathione lyase
MEQSEMTIELNLLVLRAVNCSALVQFYSALGIAFVREQHGSGPEHHSGWVGRTLLEVYPLGNSASTTGMRLGFSVPSLSAHIEAALAAGGKLVAPPQASSWGNRAVIVDPEGHKVELVEQVQSDISPNSLPAR